MAILKPPPKAPKNETLQVRIAEEIKSKVHRYAEFISSSESYVVSEALKLLFRKDDEFKEWLGTHAADHDQQEAAGKYKEDKRDSGTNSKPFWEDQPQAAGSRLNS